MTCKGFKRMNLLICLKHFESLNLFKCKFHIVVSINLMRRSQSSFSMFDRNLTFSATRFWAERVKSSNHRYTCHIMQQTRRLEKRPNCFFRREGTLATRLARNTANFESFTPEVLLLNFIDLFYSHYSNS